MLRSRLPTKPNFQSSRRCDAAADGRFECLGIGNGFHELLVRKPGLAPTARTIQVPRELELAVTLVPPATVHGAVVDARGEPVPGAVLDLLLLELEEEDEPPTAAPTEFGKLDPAFCYSLCCNLGTLAGCKSSS